MTMPTLHNCPHSGEGWCLGCVGEADAATEAMREGFAERLHDLKEAAAAVLVKLDYLQNLWGKEGVTHVLAERLRKALEQTP